MRSTSMASTAAPLEGEPRVAILLTTYNGEKFLSEQLDSIAGQTHRNWVLFASDDGSTDATLDILTQFQREQGTERVHLLQGPREGFAQNFLSLIRNPEIIADYFAFCDQDDVWFAHKIERAVLRLAPHKAIPAVYCSRTRLINEDGRVIGYSTRFERAPSFRNALVQSLAGANTMLLNQAARELLGKIPVSAPVVSHDWICYLLISGSGGTVIYDAEPSVDYRQHGDNLMGANTTLHDRLVRVRRMFSGTFRQWNQDNVFTLRQCLDSLDERSRRTVMLFEDARQAGLPRRFYLLKKAGVYRQTTFGTVGLILAASIGRL